jgi:hypothetical protein
VIAHRIVKTTTSYGSHGDELINVTYVGDTLFAYKATGDVNVPRGKVSFTVDLTPKTSGESLEPLTLSFDKSKSTATKLPRYAGKGQVAKPGFIEPAFVDGQLVLFERHFSFVWIPDRQHVLFRRPSPNQILSMLRDIISREDELINMRDHLARCFELDIAFQSSKDPVADVPLFKHEPFRRIALQHELDSMEKEAKDKVGDFRFSLLNMYKFIDNTFRNNGDGKTRND